MEFVSILVLLDSWAKTRFFDPEGVRPWTVSILVLLDSWAKTIVSPALDSAFLQRVSILVLLDSWAKTDKQAIDNSFELAFQSLFCWIHGLRQKTSQVVTSTGVGFNPCFVGFMG